MNKNNTAPVSLNRDEIKVIAMILMFGNHFSTIFLDSNTIPAMLLTGLGYFTAPVMCYFLVEGFRRTSSRIRYGKRLLAFAVISQIPFMLAFTEPGKLLEFRTVNMIGELFLCFLILWILRVNWPQPAKYAVVAALVFLSVVFDWGIRAPVFTIYFDRAGAKTSGKREAWIDVLIFYTVLEFLYLWRMSGFPGMFPRALFHLTGPCLAAFAILRLYNGKRTEFYPAVFQRIFYLFYPVHLLILGVLRLFIRG